MKLKMFQLRAVAKMNLQNESSASKDQGCEKRRYSGLFRVFSETSAAARSPRQSVRIYGTRSNRVNRGMTMLGLAALTLILGTFSAIILDRSAESYRSAATLETRLQARAAAEGAALLLAPDPTK